MTYSLLIVDDTPANFYVLEALLFKEGYDLAAVDSGRAALQAVEQCPPDLILLDVMMPEMDGIEVCQRLKNQPETSHIPILMVTALSAKEDMAACLAAGADDFLSKPVNAIELQARVRSLLRIKRQRDDLQKALTVQSAISQLREDMASMIVHDFRNPLNSILVGCELLKETELQPRQLKQVHKIDHAQRQLLNLTDDLLMMSKFEAGHLLLQPEDVVIAPIAQASLTDWELLAQRKALTFNLELSDPHLRMVIDAKLIRRLLDNLLSNAIKFSFNNTTITVQIESPTPADNLTHIRVIDQGMGVDEQIRQHIFQKYNIGTAIQGVCQLGLGLAFCKIVVEAHGGTLSVQDNHPHGAIFTAALPCQITHSALTSDLA